MGPLSREDPLAHGCVQLPGRLSHLSVWLRKSLQEALASKVSLKLSPEYRSSTLSGPRKCLLPGSRVYSLTEGRAVGEGLRALSFHSQDCKHGTLSLERYQKIQLAPTTNLLEERTQRERTQVSPMCGPPSYINSCSEWCLCHGDRALQPSCKAFGQLMCHC